MPNSSSQPGNELVKLNLYLHHILVIGLVLSTAFLVFGGVINLASDAPPPIKLVPLNQLFAGVVRMDGTSFQTIGIILLIATPILRVFGSLIFFLYQKDWLYTLATLVVLCIVLVIILIGKG